MNPRTLIALLLLLPSALFGQTKAVVKTPATNALTENLVVPTGKTLTIDAGGSLVNNGTATGFSSGLTIGSSTVTSGTNGYLLYNNSGTLGNIAVGSLSGLNASNISTGSLDLARIAQGGATTNQVLTWTGSAWAAQDASGGSVTTGANTFTRLQTITQSTANEGILASTGYSVTGSSTTTMVSLAGTWNTSGIANGLVLNITDTASNASSSYLDIQRSGTSLFKVQDNSGFTLIQLGTAPEFRCASSSSITLGGPSANVYLGDSNTFGGNIRIDGGSNLVKLQSGGKLAWSQDTTSYGTTGPTISAGTGSPESSKTANVGSLYLRTNGGAATSVYVKESGTGNTGWAPVGVPSGTVVDFAGSSAPTGWLLCYGQAVSRTTYADLFTAIGTTYGTGDGSTTFNLPDLRGRVTAGKDDMGGSAASVLTTISGLGGTGGSQYLASGVGTTVDGGSATQVPTNADIDSMSSLQPTMILNKIIKY